MSGLPCPDCGATATIVKDSRATAAGMIRRRRACPNCCGRFTTFEAVWPTDGGGHNPRDFLRRARRSLIEAHETIAETLDRLTRAGIGPEK